jgi:hypothetical protein
MLNCVMLIYDLNYHFNRKQFHVQLFAFSLNSFIFHHRRERSIKDIVLASISCSNNTYNANFSLEEPTKFLFLLCPPRIDLIGRAD